MPGNAALDLRMTVDEFLVWESGDDRRYQLIDGVIQMMAPCSAAHSALISRLSRLIDTALDALPRCRVGAEAGIWPPDSRDRYFVADLAVTCIPHERGQIPTSDPILVVEILSPSTEAEDRRIKLPAYQRIPSVREIVLVAQDRPAVEVYRQSGDGDWRCDPIEGKDSVLRLGSIDLGVPLRDVYRGLTLDADSE